MAYTIVSPQPLNLTTTIPAPMGAYTVPGTLVQLDSGQYVLLGLHSRVMQNLASLRIDGSAVVVDGTGSVVLDDNGHPTATGYGVTLSPADSQNTTTVQSWMQNAALAMLGETLTITSIQGDQNVAQASIRNAIAAAAHAGPVTDLASVL